MNKKSIVLTSIFFIFGLSAKRAADDPRFATLDPSKMIECIKNPRASNCTMQKYDKEISWIKNTVAGSVHNALLTAGFEISLAEVRHLQALAKVMPPVRALREVKRGARPQIATVHIMLDDKVPWDKLHPVADSRLVQYRLLLRVSNKNFPKLPYRYYLFAILQ